MTLTLDNALEELSDHHDVVGALAYNIATVCLEDPIKLRAYSRLPTIEKRLSSCI
jgi:hypothetical protein